jgi:uncharacterized membrane protein
LDIFRLQAGISGKTCYILNTGSEINPDVKKGGFQALTVRDEREMTAMHPIKGIWLGLLMALIGGSVAATSLATDAIGFGKGSLILRVEAPFQFWLLAGGALGLTVFGIWFLVSSVVLLNDGDYAELRMVGLQEEYGITQRKVLEYLGLFCVLTVVYAIYLQGIIHGVIEGRNEVQSLGPLMWPLLKFCVISALPFGALAFADETWRSSDAAPVALGAWMAVFAFFTSKYGEGCPSAAALLFLPLVFSALVAHALGALHYFRSRAESF